MAADQVIVAATARRGRSSPASGGCATCARPTTEHWHLLGFDRYELRRPRRTRRPWSAIARPASASATATRSPTRDLAGASRPSRLPSRCGLEQPGLLGIREGISVGYGDDYSGEPRGPVPAARRAAPRALPARPPRQRRPPAPARRRTTTTRRRCCCACAGAAARRGSTILASLPRQRALHRRALTLPPLAVLPLGAAPAAARPRLRVETVATRARDPVGDRVPARRPRARHRAPRAAFACSGAQRPAAARARRPRAGQRASARAGCSASRSTRRSPPTASSTCTSRPRPACGSSAGAGPASRLVREASLVDGIRAGTVHDSGRIASGPTGGCTSAPATRARPRSRRTRRR